MTDQRKDEMPEVWISWKEMIRQPSGEKWPCVFDHKRDYAVKYIRADLSPHVPDEVKTIAHNMGERFSFADETPSAEVEYWKDKYYTAESDAEIHAQCHDKVFDEKKVLEAEVRALREALCNKFNYGGNYCRGCGGKKGYLG